MNSDVSADSSRPITVFEWTRWHGFLERLEFPSATRGATTAEVCREFLQLAVSEGGCLLAYAKSVDPQRGRLTLIAEEFHPTLTRGKSTYELLDVIDVDLSLTGLSVETKQVQYFEDLRRKYGRRVFRDQALLAILPATTSLLVVPVRNVANPHQVLLVISLYFPSAMTIPKGLFRRLDRHTKRLADAVESNVRERAFRASIGVSQRLGRLDILTEKAYQRFADSVREALEADQVTIYVEKEWAPSELARRARSSSDDAPEDTGVPGELPIPSKVLEVRARNREFLADAGEVRDERASYLEPDPGTIPGHVLLAPLHSAGGRCIGVIRCVRRSTPIRKGVHRLFTYDDLAIVEAMEQAFAPPLETLLASEQRDVSLQKLAHELRVPTVAFRAVLERMERECREKEFRFRHPHFREAWIYAELMNRLVKEMDIVRKGIDEFPLVRQKTNVYPDVIYPARRFIEPILRKRGFAPHQLKLQLPPREGGSSPQQILDIDAALITQIIFNLLENAIKYYPRESPVAAFECTLETQVRGGFLEILVKDNGPGIPEEDRERVFDFGFRGASSAHMDVQGSGLGLWISRAMARRHDGDLELRTSNSPTTFVLSIPLPPAPRQPTPYYPRYIS